MPAVKERICGLRDGQGLLKRPRWWRHLLSAPQQASGCVVVYIHGDDAGSSYTHDVCVNWLRAKFVLHVVHSPTPVMLAMSAHGRNRMYLFTGAQSCQRDELNNPLWFRDMVPQVLVPQSVHMCCTHALCSCTRPSSSPAGLPTLGFPVPSASCSFCTSCEASKEVSVLPRY